MVKQEAAQQRDPGKHQYPARAAVDPDEMIAAK
jgi:hypothetical protein